VIPRAGELFIILLAVTMTLAFYRLPAVGDALGRLVGRKPKPPVEPPKSS
jgi:hypothetical protein